MSHPPSARPADAPAGPAPGPEPPERNPAVTLLAGVPAPPLDPHRAGQRAATPAAKSDRLKARGDRAMIPRRPAGYRRPKSSDTAAGVRAVARTEADIACVRTATETKRRPGRSSHRPHAAAIRVIDLHPAVDRTAEVGSLRHEAARPPMPIDELAHFPNEAEERPDGPTSRRNHP